MLDGAALRVQDSLARRNEYLYAQGMPRRALP
jgi:hypothetical protein